MTRGYAYREDEFLADRALAHFFAQQRPNNLVSALVRLNGTFSVVHSADSSLVAAVDRIRSMPLFYAVEGNCIHLSDDPYWVSEQVASEEYEELSVAEFLLTGYVTGIDTLHPKVKQIQAGEMLLFEETPTTLKTSAKRYYRYLPRDQPAARKESLSAEWDAILVRTFDRLIRSVAGRPIVVPLSGGYDSRLIAIMLRRLGYENVLCFTYGRPGYWEVRVAQQVAQALSYQWEYVPYNERMWYEYCHSSEFESLVRYADGLTSVVLLQDWPAVQSLKKRGSLPDDSVLVPGHGIYSVARFWALKNWNFLSRAETHEITKEKLTQEIVKENYSLWDSKRLDGVWGWKTSTMELRSRLMKKVLSSISDIPYDSFAGAASVLDFWRWQERQAKFIANSVRVYEFLDYDWRMPFWDSEVMSFWERVPMDYELRKELCIDYVKRVQRSLGIRSLVGEHPPQKRLLSAINLLEPALKLGLVNQFGSIIARIRRLSYKWAYTQSDPHARYGMMPIEKFRKFYSRRPENAYSFLALERLGKLSL